MVISRITSGLGNQLFQYAAGLTVAMREARPLFVDTSWFDYFQTHTPRRRYRLIDIGLSRAGFESAHGAHRLLQGLASINQPDIQRTVQWVFARVGTRFINEHVASQDSGELNSILPGRKVILNGYWQIYSHVEQALPVIRDQIFGSWRMSDEATSLQQRVAEKHSVAIHVRRGDYSQFGVPLLEPTYYENAAQLVCEKFRNARFYIFSEDPSWVRENIRLPGPSEVVEYNSDNRDIEDLLLMAHCSAIIIANSSFSWWGAVLGEPRRTVIAPSTWTIPGKNRPKDLYPANWIEL